MGVIGTGFIGPAHIEALRRLGIGVVAVSNIIIAVGPQRVVIGGGVSQAGDLLLDPIRRTVSERVNVTSIEQVQIVRAELGPNAGLIGAGVWVSQQAAQTTALIGEARETR